MAGGVTGKFRTLAGLRRVALGPRLWGSLFAIPLAAGLAPGQEPEIRLYRTRLPEGATFVHGVVAVPLAWVRDDSGCAYRLVVSVRDQDGLELLRDGWTASPRCPEDGGDSVAVESFRFSVLPSEYRVSVAVAPESRPGDRREDAALPLRPLSPESWLSDLVLGDRIELRSEGQTADARRVAATLGRGAVAIAAAPVPVVRGGDPKLAYYVEVYPPVSDALRLPCFLDASLEGERLETSVPLDLPGDDLSGVGGAYPLAGTVQLGGLPAGEYRMVVRLHCGTRTETRSAPFRMSPVPAALVSEPRRSGRETGYFWRISDDELRRLFDALEVWLDVETGRNVYRNLPPEGRRRFLETYFGDTEPTPNDGQDSKLDVYLQRVREAEDRFTEPGRGGSRAGWQTDRGRVYLLRGKPDEEIERRYPREFFGEGTRVRPYAIWFYNQGPGYTYLFVDDSRFGTYRLVFSTDPGFPSLPTWQELVPGAALEDLSRFVHLATAPRFQDRR